MHTHLVPLMLGEIDYRVIPIVLFGIGGLVAIAAMILHYLRQRDWNNVLRAAVEKGHPVAELTRLDPSNAPAWLRHSPMMDRTRGPRHDLRSGLILIAIGIGLHFGFKELRNDQVHVVSFEYIPAFMGLALLINASIGAVFPPKSNKESDLNEKG